MEFLSALVEWYSANDKWVNPTLAGVPGVVGFVKTSETTQKALLWVFHYPAVFLSALWYVVSFKWLRSPSLDEAATEIVKRIETARLAPSCIGGKEYLVYGDTTVYYSDVEVKDDADEHHTVRLTWAERSAVRKAYLARVAQIKKEREEMVRLAAATASTLHGRRRNPPKGQAPQTA